MKRIVCAANKSRTGLIVCGVRHYDEIMHSVIEGQGWSHDHCMEQGFIDNRGSFLSRKEAWAIALAAGQVIRRVGGDQSGGGTLYSENLY